MVKVNKQKKLIVGLVVLILVFATAILLINKENDNKKNDILINYLNAMIADKDAAEIKDKAGIDITDEFLEKYSESINNQDYDNAMKEIRQNTYSFSVKETPKNRQFLEIND